MWNSDRLCGCNQCADGKYCLQDRQEGVLGCQQKLVYRHRGQSIDQGQLPQRLGSSESVSHLKQKKSRTLGTLFMLESLDYQVQVPVAPAGSDAGKEVEFSLISKRISLAESL